MDKILLFNLVKLLKSIACLASNKIVFFEKCVIIDDIDRKTPFLSGIFQAGWGTGKEVF